jgi:Amt family ammonium transporter
MLGWLVVEQIRYKKPTALGAASGLVAGLVGITPAAGFVSLGSAAMLGLFVGVVCSLAVSLKHKFNFDDSLDVVGVHGVGGMLGAILTGVLATETVNSAVGDSLKTNGGRVGLIVTQVLAVLAVAAFAAVGTAIIIKITQAVVGIRTSDDDESLGLDLALHGESGYNL